MLSDHAWSEISTALDLTKRELQIVKAIFDNFSEVGIAKKFGISPHTVHTHLNRVFKKLNITTRTQLVLRIMEKLLSLTASATGQLPPICAHHQNRNCCLHNSPANPPS